MNKWMVRFWGAVALLALAGLIASTAWPGVPDLAGFLIQNRVGIRFMVKVDNSASPQPVTHGFSQNPNAESPAFLLGPEAPWPRDSKNGFPPVMPTS